MVTPCGPCLCVSNGDELFGGIGVMCTIVFSLALSVLSILTCTNMGSIRPYDKKQRADLATLIDFNGCSDEFTAVSTEVIENSSI